MNQRSGKGASRFSRNDWTFISIVAVVVLVLVVGSSERKTTPTPNDQIHIAATSRAACMSCHGEDGSKPKPPGHVKADQCFQCHAEPEGWKKP